MSQRAEESYGRDSLGSYLDEIARTPLLSAEEEVELAIAMESGLEAEYILNPEAHKSGELDEGKILVLKKLGELATTEELEWLVEEGRRAKQQFIHANLGLAVSIARKYSWSSLPLLDRIQEGNLGLLQAVEKFDYKRGVKFSTFAHWWIHREVRLGIANTERMIRLPREVNDEMHVMNTREQSLEVLLGRAPDTDEIAEEVGTTPERIVQLKEWRREHISLQLPVGDDETTLGDLLSYNTLPGPDETILEVDKHERVLRLIDQLGEGRQKDVILLRFGFHNEMELTTREAGEVINLSPAGASREQTSALNRLREMVPDRESFDNAPANMNFAADTPEKPGKQNQRLLTIAESKVLQGLIRDGLDLGAQGLTDTEIAMLTLYSQTRSNSAVQRQFGTKPARTKTILKMCIEAVRPHIDAAQGTA